MADYSKKMICQYCQYCQYDGRCVEKLTKLTKLTEQKIKEGENYGTLCTCRAVRGTDRRIKQKKRRENTLGTRHAKTDASRLRWTNRAKTTTFCIKPMIICLASSSQVRGKSGASQG
jgi:hypothetical protein